MPDTTGSIEYLQNLPLYATEKPYYALFAPSADFDPNAKRLDNLEYEFHNDIRITDIRGLPSRPTLANYGFEVLEHESKHVALASREECRLYQRETEGMLADKLGAVFVKCYEVRKRENVPIIRDVMDYNDPLLIEGPARGAHSGKSYIPILFTLFAIYVPFVLISTPIYDTGSSPDQADGSDVTYKSGPQIINRYMSDDEKAEFLKPGYRFRIVK